MVLETDRVVRLAGSMAKIITALDACGRIDRRRGLESDIKVDFEVGNGQRTYETESEVHILVAFYKTVAIECFIPLQKQRTCLCVDRD